ncbi:polysaccharide deacetylase family protein [Polycladomyces zharkentensis]|nr:polysaccharide deacetylase family protein [Polycladomyces sp. WAk]
MFGYGNPHFPWMTSAWPSVVTPAPTLRMEFPSILTPFSVPPSIPTVPAGVSQLPPLSGGPERPGQRPPYSRTIDWASLYPRDVILRGPMNRREVALTFDDGPDAVFTQQILNVLRRTGVKGTFFVVGRRVQRYPGVFQRMLREGHEVGNHSWSHPKMSRQSAGQVRTELQRASGEMNRVGNVRPRFFRPPYGALSETVIRVAVAEGYKIILWNVDSLDWSGIPGTALATNVLSHVRPGSIILMHSATGRGGHLQNTVQALPGIIQRLRREGYRFVRVSELLDIRAYG